MVKTLLAAFLLFLIAVPALAQDDFPRIEVGFGYANLTLPPPAASPATGILSGAPTPTATGSTHNSGFSMVTDLNFTKTFGFENYTGYYSLGNGYQLFTNIMCGKVAYRTDKFTPYATAGIGGANSIVNAGGFYASSGSGLATKLGGGVDYRFSDVMALKFDVSRLQVHSPVYDPFTGLQTGSVWLGKFNLSAGIVLTIMQ